MAYDEELTARMRSFVEGLEGVSEKKMMGGMCFLLNGHMIGGADRSKTGQGRFLFRVGKPNDNKAATMPGAEPLMQGGKRLTGLFFVAEDICDDTVMKEWMSLAIDHALSLPAKA
ncbi:RNA methyltransferase [Hwanghaeella grinnelliae]|uniref:RNA methyltransferase n=1 Tax=Hwanghaeella grinnelliae TaxID=2500179 RepID=A0A3S2VMY5_9PROT|nr:TfoX/Sxy family protein [Hwanghaeella grinnelliae]RVU34142.1 RNA methyltransferase [Hwanghaeella grinnelliae]